MPLTTPATKSLSVIAVAADSTRDACTSEGARIETFVVTVTASPSAGATATSFTYTGTTGACTKSSQAGNVATFSCSGFDLGPSSLPFSVTADNGAPGVG